MDIFNNLNNYNLNNYNLNNYNLNNYKFEGHSITINLSENSSKYLPQIDYEALSEYINLLEDTSPLGILRVFDTEYYYAIYVSDNFYANNQIEINSISKHILNKYSDFYTKNIICFSESEFIEELGDEEIFIKNKHINYSNKTDNLLISFEISSISSDKDNIPLIDNKGYEYAA